MGIGAGWIQLHGTGLIGDRRLGITQGQLHVAAVAPGRRIVWSQRKHLVPQGQGLLKAALAAGREGLVKHLGQRQLHHQQQGQEAAHAASSSV